MKISFNWLNDYIDLSDIKPEHAAEMLTMKSAEVESSEWVGAHFEKVIVAKVEKVEPHPDSDHLKLATVFDGEKSQTVVCGAPNVAQNQTVAFAPLGTVLPGDFVIKPVKIRGVESCGMICAEDELGVGTDHEGIMVLDDSLKAGTPVSEIFGKKDFIIEIENKTINHRPDMWGHIGIARELKAIFEKPWKKELKYKGITPEVKEGSFKIEINTEKCLHYLGLKMSKIEIKPSPLWLQKRLENIGVRSINNIVDIANYVMFETGHPLHTFDMRDISGRTIVIRNAENGENFTTLDGVLRTLSSEDAVIADEAKSLAIAGVMGGLNSEIKDDTKEIFVESALFQPGSVRKTANKLDLRTDSSSRFEKALWVENCYLAMERFVELAKEIVPGITISSELAFADNSENYGFKGLIEVEMEKIYTLLGIGKEELSVKKAASMLHHLGFTVAEEGDFLKVEVPFHRRSKDVSIAEDIIEEIGRIYGYGNIKPVSPKFNMESAKENISLKKEKSIRNLMVYSFRANEVMNYSFCGKNELDAVNFPEERLVETVDSREAPYLRYSMAPALLKNVVENLKNFKDFNLFEFGRVFFEENEKRRFASVSVGEDANFMWLKKIVVSFEKEFKTPPLRFERVSDSYLLGSQILHPNQSAVVFSGKTPLGILGMVHPILLKKYDISIPVGYIEIEIEELFALPKKSTKFSPLLKFPSTGFDVTVIIPNKTEVADIFNLIKKSVEQKWFIESKIVDYFSGSPIPEGFLSVSFRIVLNAKERTLSGDEMKGVQQKLFDDIRKAGYKISGD
ncbi:MAG: phenylalanine--tRNA ligase subunit beta [bacterium]